MIAVHQSAGRWGDLCLRAVAGRARWLDPIFAACAFVALEAEALTSPYRRGPLLLNVVVVAVMAFAALWRRRLPLLFLAAVAGGAIALHQGLAATSSSYGTLTGLYCVLIPTYAVGAWEDRTRAILGLALWVAAASAIVVLNDGRLIELVPAGLTAIAMWVAGRLMRAQRMLAQDVERKLARLESERADRARLAAAAERVRIARDLHGVVTESVAGMVVQAEMAAQLLDRDTPDADLALGHIEVTGREALGEMRRILGVLRRPGDRRELAPQPGAGDIEALVRRARDRGVSIDLHNEGEPSPLPTGTGLAAYRVLEAALEQLVERHTGSASLAMTSGSGALRLDLTVRDEEGRLDWPTPTMREWTELSGAAVLAYRDGGRLCLRVSLPTRDRVAR